MKKSLAYRLAFAGVIGALYAALSIFGSVFGLTYGPIQLRFAEALTVLPFLFPETVGGLFVGCFVANLLSPYGVLDMVVGSLATLLAAFLTSCCRHRALAPLPPVLVNAVFIGALLAWQQTGMGEAFMAAFWYNACSIAVSQALVCYILGLLLLRWMEKSKFFVQIRKNR